MTTIDEIKKRQDELAKMIADFEKEGGTSAILFPRHRIELLSGERYAGIMLGGDGLPSHHLVLLPYEEAELNWHDAMTWARTIWYGHTGPELPTLREQALLFANLRDEFKDSSYWSCEQYASNSDYAWCQTFCNSYQHPERKAIKLRARAVRRVFL